MEQVQNKTEQGTVATPPEREPKVETGKPKAPTKKPAPKVEETKKKRVIERWYICKRMLENYKLMLQAATFKLHPTSGVRETIDKDKTIDFEWGLYATEDPVEQGKMEEYMSAQGKTSTALHFRECTEAEVGWVNLFKENKLPRKTWHARLKAMEVASSDLAFDKG